mgnify:FL=1
MYSSEQFANKYEAGLNHIASLYETIFDQVGPISQVERRFASQQLLATIANTDFKELFEVQFGIKGELDKIAESYIDALRAMDGFADVDEDILGALIRSDLNLYRSKLDDTYVQMKSLFTESIINGLEKDVFVNELTRGQRGVLSTRQAMSLYDDSLAKFNRSVTKQMAFGSPKNTLYIFEGPVDSRTSDDCLQVMAAGPMTLGEIDKRFPGVFENGSHFNCRHEFFRFTSSGQYEEAQLQKQFDTRDLKQRTSLIG